MLKKFQSLKGSINNIDFPIGYYVENNKINGLIVPYYDNSPSLKNICDMHSFSELRRYYNHDTDDIHNIYLLCHDILNIIETLYNNGIYYSDIHLGNFVFANNEVKIIDFDNRYINFYDTKNNAQLINILRNYESLVFEISKKFNLAELAFYKGKTIKNEKSY